MKQIENTGGLQKRDKSLPRKGLSSVLKCLTQPVGTADDAANEGKSPLSMLKRTKRKFSYRPVRQISSPRKPDPSRTELQNDEKSQHDLIGGILDIFKSTLAQFKSSGGYATVEKGPQGREAIVLHEAESSASSTVPKEGKVRIRFPKESLLVLQPPKPIADSPNKDEYELSIEVKPPSIARYASQTIKLAKDKILIGMKDGEGIMQINEPPTKRSFHMTIEEDVKGKPCVKVNVTESKNPNENRYHDSQMVIEGPAKCDSQEHNPVNDEDEKGKPTKLSSEENLRDEEFSLPDRISPKNLPQPERLPPDFNARQAHYKKPFHDYCHFRQTDLQLPEFRELNHPEGENRRYPILVTELFIPRPSDNEAVANSESGKMNSPDRAFVTSPPELSCEKQNSTLSPRFQPNDGGSRPQTPSQARSVNGEAPNLHSPIDKRPMDCQKQYVKMGGRVELRNTERRTTWSTTDRVMPPHHEPGPHWPTAGKNVSHFYSSMKLRKEIASICHYPSNRELGESYPESLPSKFWDFCLTGRDSNEGRFRTQAFGQYGPRNNHSCSCRNKIPSFSESEDPINPDPRPAPPPPEIARDVKSSSSDGPKQDKNTISVVNLALCGNYRNQHISGKNVVDTKNKKSSTVAPSKAKWTFPKSSGEPLSKPNTDTRSGRI
ncbi:unnamed protein product [Nesidiocoris tenuis]|uniref:Uncharacterized protein n=1 Tax=Nesidiocoris tenuis TaxID=355587 RepID=A0A6H5H4W1_9HEMI|nr:unnamed protein product [Nesidiocoris tenuis]